MSTPDTGDHYPETQYLTIPIKDPSRGHITITATVTPQADPKEHGLHLLFPPSRSAPSSSPSPLPSMDDCMHFPVMTARVKAEEIAGYGAIFGWIQLVRSTDQADDDGEVGWKMDPIPVLNTLDTPFCYLGVEPTAFDAPVRSLPDSNEEAKDVDWIAHAFLCVMDDCLLTRKVKVIGGFEWGFGIAYGGLQRSGDAKRKWVRKINVKRLTQLDDLEKSWEDKLEILEVKHPLWEFGQYSPMARPHKALDSQR